MKRLEISALFLGMAGMGAILASRGLAEPPAAERQSDVEKLTALLKERRDTLRLIVDDAERDHRAGMVSPLVVSRVTVDWLNAELDLAANHAARIAVRERIVAHFRKTEAALENNLKRTQVAQAKGREGAPTESYEFLSAKAARCQAEIDLLRERANAK